MAWFKIIPQDKKLLKSSRVRRYLRYLEDELEKEVPIEAVMNKVFNSLIYGTVTHWENKS